MRSSSSSSTWRSWSGRCRSFLRASSRRSSFVSSSFRSDLAGGLGVRAHLAVALARRALGGDCGNRLLSRHSAAGASDLRLFRAAVCRLPAIAPDGGRHRVFPQHVELLRRDLSRRHRKRGPGPMGCRTLDRPAGLPDAGLCRAAAGGAQRASRSRFQHRRGGEAHLDRERGCAAGAALFGRHGALGDLQFARRSCWLRQSTLLCCGRSCA